MYTDDCNESSDDDIFQSEPQTTSSDPVERKTARSLRINKREDAIKRREATLSGHFEFIESDSESVSIVEKQVAECTSLLEHLLADGEEKVTNIRVANDTREIARRFSESQKKRDLLGKLEAEATLAQEKFDKISAQWNVILNLNNPLDIEKEVNFQKEQCRDLIDQKNSIINELKDELKTADNAFYKDLQKQLNDIKQLGERIDSQVILMKNVYRTQLELIENSIAIERNDLLRKDEKQWNVLYHRRDLDEINNIEEKVKQISKFKNKIDIMTNEHQEKYRIIKIQFENDIQTLHKELQDLKTTCLINTEKIDYIYQVLKRREEENVLIRTQQKRRLNKMQDIIKDLKLKIEMTKKEGVTEKTKCNKEIQKLEISTSDLKVKANNFSSVNEKKYQQIWEMNESKCKKLITRINQTDKVIHEQILGIDWTKPKTCALDETQLLFCKKYKNTNKTQESTDTTINTSKTEKMYNIENFDEILNEPSQKLINHILTLIADRSGFLIEEKLWKILEKYEEVPTKLCKLENIFDALGIESEYDIKILSKHFIKYCHCELCENTTDIFPQHTYKTEETEEEKPIDFNNKFDIDIENLTETCSKTDIIEGMKCKNGHQLKINSNSVLNALQTFMELKTKNEKTTDGRLLSGSRSISSKYILQYWQRHKDTFTPQNEKLWDNLTVGLTKYLPILQDRYKLNEEVLQFRKQNIELKNLLGGYMSSNNIPKQKHLTPLDKK